MPRSFHSFLFDSLRPRPGRGPRPGRVRSKPPLMASVPKGAIRSPSALAISGAENAPRRTFQKALGRRAIAVVGGVECGSQSGGLCLKEAILFRHDHRSGFRLGKNGNRAAWPSVPCRAVSILFSSTAFARVLAVAHGQDAGNPRSKPPLMASVPKGSDPLPFGTGHQRR